MTDLVPLNVSIDKELKEEAEAILAEHGISAESALTFLYQSIVDRHFDSVGIDLSKQGNS